MVANVIGHDVLYELETFLLGGLHHSAVVFVAAIARVNAVIVGACVAMVRKRGLIVFKQRGGPDGCVAHACYVIQVIYKACNVTAMTTLLRFPIGFVRKACLVVVGGVAIGKAVGHQIEHYICTAKTLTQCRIFSRAWSS